MKFDVIISNPPYNKDMYLDFVEAAYDLLNEDGVGVFITPAKFYAKGGQKNEHFRQKIMPHIHNVHLYKCCTDVFDIAESSGIACYDVYKSKMFSEKIITNHSKNAFLDDRNLPEIDRTHIEQPVEFIPLSALRLIEKCKIIANNQLLFNRPYPTPMYFYTNDSNGDQQVYEHNIKILAGNGNVLTHRGNVSLESLKNTLGIDKYKAVMCSMMASGCGFTFDKNLKMANKPPIILGPYEVASSYSVLYIADTAEEVDYFCSYYNSQLINFITMLTKASNHPSTLESWRHVPALPTPYKFDHIYTNEEIFDIFQLTPDERKLITSITKERAKKGY